MAVGEFWVWRRRPESLPKSLPEVLPEASQWLPLGYATIAPQQNNQEAGGLSIFEQETASQAMGDGLYRGTISGRWNIGANPNGGYLVAVVLRAIAQLNPDHPDPLSVTTHYLRPGLPDQPCEVQVELVRQGRSMTSARARLVQGGKTRLELLSAFGDLSSVPNTAPPDADITLAPPVLPSPESCPERSGTAQGVDLPILERVEIRINPSDAGLFDSALPGAGQAARAEVSGWIRLRDNAPTSSIAAVTFTDAFPPALFSLLGVIGWVPTVELTVHVRRRPTTPWLLGRFVTDDLQGGRMIESGALWDESGALVAQSRQLGLLLGKRD